MRSISSNRIQLQIIGLLLSLLAILLVLAVVHSSFTANVARIENQLRNQSAKQDVGMSIYYRLYAAETLVFKLSGLNNRRELQTVKKRFDDNLLIIQNGLSVLQDGGYFEDRIATNIPGKNAMYLSAHYLKPDYELFALEVLELGPALYDMDEQVQLFTQLIESRLEEVGSHHEQSNGRERNFLKAIDATLQRSQENAARILHDSQLEMESLSLRLEQAEKHHDYFQFPVIALSIGLAVLILIMNLVRINKAILKRDEAEEQLHLLLQTTAEGIYGIDKEGKTTFVNPAAARMLGYTAEELIGRGSHPLIHHSHRDGSSYPVEECRMLEVLKSGVSQTVNAEVLWNKNGASFPVEYSSTPIIHNSQVVGTVVNFRDISERKEAEKQIHMLSQAVEQSPVSVVITNLKGDIEYVNSAFSRATGYSADEVKGQNPRILQSGNTLQTNYEDLWQALTNGRSWQGEFQNCKKNGETIVERAYIAPVIDSSGVTTHYLGVKEDITLHRQQEEKILHQANYDSLTDLPNRFLTMDRLAQLIKEAQRTEKLAAVLFLDLDDFKTINDTMSHEVGDELLIKVAKRLRDSVRDGDTVSRLGGDEFIVLMGNLSTADDAYPVAEKLLDSFRNTFLLGGQEKTVTVSIGLAIFPYDGQTPAELLRNADSALYLSKSQGRNTYNYYTDTMTQGVSRRVQIEEQLHGALKRNELKLAYKPVIEIGSNKVVGAEAVLRWHNSVLGELLPHEFLSIAEKSGQIFAIGQFVLNQALSMVTNLQRPDFRIGINLSLYQFRDPALLHQIEEALQRAGVSPTSLELEITEAVLMGGGMKA